MMNGPEKSDPARCTRCSNPCSSRRPSSQWSTARSRTCLTSAAWCWNSRGQRQPVVTPEASGKLRVTQWGMGPGPDAGNPGWVKTRPQNSTWQNRPLRGGPPEFDDELVRLELEKQDVLLQEAAHRPRKAPSPPPAFSSIQTTFLCRASHPQASACAYFSLKSPRSPKR